MGKNDNRRSLKMRRRKAQVHKKDRDVRRTRGESQPHPHSAHLDDEDDDDVVEDDAGDDSEE